ncbi:expressed unknown protein [Seminavis robusta]|uniref:Transmembrane protein n=1 Tax=Seminavis robusta TaxID=568900 RepID=A0A9N8D4V8_9STRA|nr:expressed unknown protein [Seminavis robusta]|eukprot:Sro5_g004751.1  (160) ;mRNA; r:246913-247392
MDMKVSTTALLSWLCLLLCFFLIVDGSEAFSANLLPYSLGSTKRSLTSTTSHHGPTPSHLFFRRHSLQTVPKIQAAPNRKDSNEGTPSFTTIEDGSPLGVAIVAIGSLLLLGNNGVDASTSAGDSPWAGVIFVTASVAAGISRMVRYNIRKQKEINKEE